MRYGLDVVPLGAYADHARTPATAAGPRQHRCHPGPAAFSPFFLPFCDNGGKVAERQRIIDMLAPGGLLVLDDFTPSPTCPPTFAGQRDHQREFWLTQPELVTVEVLTTPDEFRHHRREAPSSRHGDGSVGRERTIRLG